MSGLERFERPVRCSKGHLFTTLWVPLGSLKAVRLGHRRYQWCPVGRHWALVTPLDRGPHSAREVRRARKAHDLRIP